MSTHAFLLILISAVMHALWNLLVKRSRHKTIFIWWMFVCSGGLFSLVLPFLPVPFTPPDRQVVLLALAGALCFALYHLFNGRAYRDGDLSIAYPLSQTSMIYVPLWGIFLFGERPSIIGIAGILMVIAGAYSVQLRSLSLAELLLPFKSLGSPSVQSALTAGFIYSLGAIADKAGVTRYSPLYFTYILVVAMLALMTLNILRSHNRTRLLDEWRENRGLILASGPVMVGSFLTFRYGLKLAPMGYAVPVRQVSILVGVLIGVLFLGEPCGRFRLLAALLILAGATLIRFG